MLLRLQAHGQLRQDAESRTAVLVCAGRALAHGRTSAARYSDPTAELLLPPAERDRVAAIRDAPGPPDGMRPRRPKADWS